MSDKRFSKRDLERNEDPKAIAGAVTGATSAGFVSGIGLAALGPIGAVAGALAGAVGGWWAGKEFHKAVVEMDKAENRFRESHEHAGATRPYEEARHGYQIGYLAGRNPDYVNADFSEVEDDLRAAWVQAHLQDPEVRWEEVRGDARVGYEVARER
jgi:uncharacterized protein YcfJ